MPAILKRDLRLFVGRAGSDGRLADGEQYFEILPNDWSGTLKRTQVRSKEIRQNRDQAPSSAGDSKVEASVSADLRMPLKDSVFQFLLELLMHRPVHRAEITSTELSLASTTITDNSGGSAGLANLMTDQWVKVQNTTTGSARVIARVAGGGSGNVVLNPLSGTLPVINPGDTVEIVGDLYWPGEADVAAVFVEMTGDGNEGLVNTACKVGSGSFQLGRDEITWSYSLIGRDQIPENGPVSTSVAMPNLRRLKMPDSVPGATVRFADRSLEISNNLLEIYGDDERGPLETPPGKFAAKMSGKALFMAGQGDEDVYRKFLADNTDSQMIHLANAEGDLIITLMNGKYQDASRDLGDNRTTSFTFETESDGGSRTFQIAYIPA